MLTKLELEIINHRLAAEDAIIDALNEQGFAEEIDMSIYNLSERHEKIDFANVTPIEEAVIIDCMDGSTFFAQRGDWSPAAEAAYNAAADRLEAKAKKAFNKSVSIPRR